MHFTPEVSPLELEMGICKISHKKSPLGRKSKLLSVYRVGLAICIEMVGPVCQCCHFPCLGGLPSPTLRANGAAAVISPCFFQIYSEFFRAAARPGHGARGPERFALWDRERDGRSAPQHHRLCIFLMGKRNNYIQPLWSINHSWLVHVKYTSDAKHHCVQETIFNYTRPTWKIWHFPFNY